MSARRESQSGSGASEVIVQVENSTKDTRTEEWVQRQSSEVTADQILSGQ